LLSNFERIEFFLETAFWVAMQSAPGKEVWTGRAAVIRKSGPNMFQGGNHPGPGGV
jgi:hypothetical protein